MTGPEHFDEAEKLLLPVYARDGATRAEMLAEAQVNATLALADFFRAWIETVTR